MRRKKYNTYRIYLINLTQAPRTPYSTFSAAVCQHRAQCHYETKQPIT